MSGNIASFFFTGALLLLSSCYSLRPPKAGFVCEPQVFHRDSTCRYAYVMNAKEFPKEFLLFKRSGLYTISEDSSCALKVKLKPLRQIPKFRCATGLVAAIVVTLGQVPVRIPEKYAFEYNAFQEHSEKTVSYELDIDRRIWFWDMFSVRKSKPRVLAKALKTHLQ